ncbi:MAG TPA: RsmE family RNA methyltransferase [Terriglobia bacterium]|nr:RsmE family RNA methyltransferase [Terriglobia bacterium]
MALRSVYTPDPDWVEDGLLRITGDELRHLLVARIEAGETIEAFDGKGAVWTAVVELTGKKEVLARVTNHRTAPPDPCPLILGMALVRSAAFELALEKAVEIGVGRIAPFIAARSNAAPPRQMDRWTRIVVEAAKQSKRFRLPAVDAPARFEEILEIPARTRVVFAERDGGPLKAAVKGSPALYLIGPEGGWTDEELDKARSGGFALVSLGSGILKAETAAIVGSALLRYCL